jgi:hypothetical protein
MNGVIEITGPCGARTGAGGLREEWRTWSPAERAQFVDGLAGLGWIPQAAVDFESTAYPGFVALPGNPCYRGMTGGPEGSIFGNRFGDDGGSPLGTNMQFAPAGLLERLRELAGRLAGAIGDALRRALDGLSRLLGIGLGGLGLALLLLLLGGGALLIARSRR